MFPSQGLEAPEKLHLWVDLMQGKTRNILNYISNINQKKTHKNKGKRKRVKSIFPKVIDVQHSDLAVTSSEAAAKYSHNSAQWSMLPNRGGVDS